MARKLKTTATTVPTTNGSLTKGWRMVRFGEVVRDVNEAERNPLEAGLERFVGLEHIEPENLHLKQWGLLADGEISFTKRFRKGQVLFGKRRAYQRKVAVAEFDGICSSDILTFEPKADDLLPELLPFIVQSEGFFEHALGTSSGSLSPRTRWSQLQDYEFPLPPKDEQRRIADILLSADEACRQLRQVVFRNGEFKYALVSHLWKEGIASGGYQVTEVGRVPAHWKVAPLGHFTIESAYGPRFSGEEYSPTGNVQTVRTTDFDRLGGLILKTAPFANLPDDVISKHRLVPGDFLLSRTGEYAGLTATFNESSGCYVAAAFLIRFHLDPLQLLSEYLVHLCYSDFGKRFVLRLVTGSAQPNINGSDMLALKIPVPPLEEQREIIQMADQADASEKCARENLENCIQLVRAVSNDMFATRK